MPGTGARRTMSGGSISRRVAALEKRRPDRRGMVRAWGAAHLCREVIDLSPWYPDAPPLVARRAWMTTHGASPASHTKALGSCVTREQRRHVLNGVAAFCVTWARTEPAGSPS